MADASDGRLFVPGDAVRVREGTPAHHHRTPAYIKGKIGKVTAICGVFHNPETRAHDGTGIPMQPLYRVSFDQTSLWEGYPGGSNDEILVDIYENWLEPARA